MVGIVAAATGATTADEDPAFTVVATFLQSLIFIGTAVLFASFTRKPRPEHFGLRPTAFWPAVGWAALGIATFYIAVGIYTAVRAAGCRADRRAGPRRGRRAPSGCSPPAS